MNATLREKWITALRSGNYAQCEGKLHRNVPTEFCCLGVLLDVISPTWSPADHGWRGEMGTCSNPYSYLVTVIGDYDFREHLIDLNDKKRQNFDRIADWIEANIPEDVPNAPTV